MTKIKTMTGICLAFLCASQTALAQDLRARPAAKFHGTVHETLDASMARLAVKATFQPSAQPTRQELLGVILLMSLREQRGNGT